MEKRQAHLCLTQSKRGSCEARPIGFSAPLREQGLVSSQSPSASAKPTEKRNRLCSTRSERGFCEARRIVDPSTMGFSAPSREQESSLSDKVGERGSSLPVTEGAGSAETEGVGFSLLVKKPKV